VKSIFIDSMNDAYLVNPVANFSLKIPEWPGKMLNNPQKKLVELYGILRSYLFLFVGMNL
jgi:hypothetical protein